MLRCLVLVLLALLAPAARAACPDGFPTLQAGWNRDLPVDGQRRDVWVLLPPPADAPAPLFLAFNGTSEDGARFARRAGLQDLAARGFVVLAPSSAGNGAYWPVWDALRARGEEDAPNPDLALFDTLVACARAQRPIDADRIYAGGHSAGGIFTHHLVQRRSDVLAGVIAASGIYGQTSPGPDAPPMAPTTVLITWGGRNDRWSGRAGAAAVTDIQFASEAAAAGAAYAAREGVQVVSCSGDELGHAWLDELNGWMAEVLLARPRGAPPLDALPPLPPGARARCQLGPVADAPVVGLACRPSATPGCTAACQQIADGAATNRTVGAVLRGELRRLGFAEGSCDGCVARCEALATTPADAEGLACLQAQPRVDRAVPGLAGAMPLVEAIDACCGPNDGPWCRAVCGELRGNLAARSYVPACAR